MFRVVSLSRTTNSAPHIHLVLKIMWENRIRVVVIKQNYNKDWFFLTHSFFSLFQQKVLFVEPFLHHPTNKKPHECGAWWFYLLSNHLHTFLDNKIPNVLKLHHILIESIDHSQNIHLIQYPLDFLQLNFEYPVQ